MTNLAYAQEHLRDIAARSIKAQDDFIETLQQLGNITQEQAEGVFGFMQRHKMLKFDAWFGKYNVKHGAYLDQKFIEQLAIHGAF